VSAYLDHAATTPMLPDAVAAMVDELARLGNASSLHASGRRARRVVEEAREQVAAALGAGPSEVIFTAGGTEADNLAVKGLFWARRAADPQRVRILASAVEHHAVIDSVEWLSQAQGARVDWLPVDALGRVHPDAVQAAIERDPGCVALISVMWANNEVGTVQPISAIADLAHEFGIPMHTDAVQAVGQLPVDFAASGVDCLSVSAHKLGGPVGAGALIARRGLELTPVQHGGGQERGARSGTLDAASVRGFAVAAAAASGARPDAAVRLADLRNEAVTAVRAAVPDAVLRGPRSCRSPARQRALHLPRLRRGLAALPAGRPGSGVLHRVRLPGRCAPAQSRPAGDGRQRRAGEGCAAVLVRAHLDRARRRRPGRGDRPRGRSSPPSGAGGRDPPMTGQRCRTTMPDNNDE
jgi:cysteine desulfurase